MRLRMYQVLLFKSRRHLCKGSVPEGKWKSEIWRRVILEEDKAIQQGEASNKNTNAVLIMSF